MRFVYPIDINSTNLKNSTKFLKGASNMVGYYPIGRLNNWHGGIHFEGNLPIKCIADGVVIAFRVAEDYLEETIDGKTSKYSNCFVLIEHKYKLTEEDELVFYSLYNHLIPYKEMIHPNVPNIFRQESFMVNTDNDIAHTYGLNIWPSKEKKNPVVVPYGATLFIEKTVPDENKKINNWWKSKSIYKRIRYTGSDGKVYRNYFVFAGSKQVKLSENGKYYTVITTEDKEKLGDIKGLNERSKPIFEDKYINKVIPKETTLDLDLEDTGGNKNFARVINKDGTKGGYVHVESCKKTYKCALPKKHLNTINNVAIKVDAGDIIGYSGLYGFEKAEDYRSAHVEIFTPEDPSRLIKNESKQGNNAKKYCRIQKDFKLENEFPYQLLKNSRVKLLESKGSYAKIEICDIDIFIPDRKSYLGSYLKGWYTFDSNHKEQLTKCNTLSNNLFKSGDKLELLDTKEEYQTADAEAKEKYDKLAKEKKKKVGYAPKPRNVKYHYNLKELKFWIPNTFISPVSQPVIEQTEESPFLVEEKVPSDTLSSQNKTNVNLIAVDTNANATQTATEIVTATNTSAIVDDGYRFLAKQVNKLFIEHPDNTPENNTPDTDIIVNLDLQTKYVNHLDEEWFYINHEDFDAWGNLEKYNGLISSKLSGEQFSAYNWDKFGFEILEGTDMDKYIYSDPSDPLLDKICKLVYKDKDTNNKEAIKSIDQDGDGILEPHELQRAFNKPYIAHRLSHLVVKHTSEWAYLGNKVSALKSDIQAIFDDAISTEEDEALKNTLETLKEERLTAFEKRIKQLAIWDRVNPPKKSYASKIVDGTLLANPVTAIPYLEYRLGKWAYKKLTSDEETEKEINLAPYKFDKPEVYHFHPIAFVEQMRRVSGSWHDPIRNPQLNKYSFSANITPYNGAFGNVRPWRTPALHSGIDIFAIPGTEVYACMDGIVKRTNEGGGGKTLVIKVDNTKDFIKQLKEVNYSLVYEDNGELMGAEVREADNVYLIYMHLSEFKCSVDDKVKAGDLVALAGVTGNANGTRGPHVHFEIATLQNPYGTGVNNRINPARAIFLQSYDTKEQDKSKNYKYYNNETKKKA